MPPLVQRMVEGIKRDKAQSTKNRKCTEHVSVNLRGMTCSFLEHSHPPPICSLYAELGGGCLHFPLCVQGGLYCDCPYAINTPPPHFASLIQSMESLWVRIACLRG